MSQSDTGPRVAEPRIYAAGPVKAEERAASRVVLNRLEAGRDPTTEAEWKASLHDTTFRVTRMGATEPRGITVSMGGFDDFWGDGTYQCACCGASLYDSMFKFDCGCGWPGFYNCNRNSVFAVQDKDGVRTEMRCMSCDAHVGHITIGEGFKNPPPNERHCVNSSAVSFRARTGEVTQCTYRGPVFMFTGRAPGEKKSDMKYLAGGDSLPPGSVWACIDSFIKIIANVREGLLGYELHRLICIEAGIDTSAQFLLQVGDDVRRLTSDSTERMQGKAAVDVRHKYTTSTHASSAVRAKLGGSSLAALVELRGVVVLDGGMGTALVDRGKLSTAEAWSAGWRLHEPHIRKAVLEAYQASLHAGADVLTVNTYKVSVESLRNLEVSDPEFMAAKCMRENMAVAQEALSAFHAEKPDASARLLAVSLGPYGSIIAGRGSTANRRGADDSTRKPGYGVPVTELQQFHKSRLMMAVEAGARLIAYETLPDLIEAKVIVNALKNYEGTIEAWLTFTSTSTDTVDHGDSFEACVEVAAASPCVVGIGVNCVEPHLVSTMLQTARKHTDKLLVCYPNSGECWDKSNGIGEWKWLEGTAPGDFASAAMLWHERDGASVIGGCCRVTADDIASFWDKLQSSHGNDRRTKRQKNC